MRTVLLYALILGLTVSSQAAVYVIRPDGTGDFPTIQAGVDAAVDGDVLELTDGVFLGDGNRDVDYLGKPISIISQSGDPQICVIDCEGSEIDPHRGFNIISGESGAELNGVTIRNGWLPQSPGGGAAVMCDNASSLIFINCIIENNNERAVCSHNGCTLTITDCLFEQNFGLSGGAIACHQSTLILNGCGFIGNTTTWDGGAIGCSFSSVQMAHCHFIENSARKAAAINFVDGSDFYVSDCLFARNNATEMGGAVFMFCGVTGTFDHCTFDGNTAGAGGAALYIEKVSDAHLRECTFWGHGAAGAYGSVIYCGEVAPHCLCENTIIAFSVAGQAVQSIYADDVEMTCCDLYGNAGGDWVGHIAGQYGINGNISEDPLFCDPEGGDFTLHSNSRCAPFSPPNTECDLIGAHPIGCGSTPVTSTTWGGIKALFR